MQLCSGRCDVCSFTVWVKRQKSPEQLFFLDQTCKKTIVLAEEIKACLIISTSAFKTKILSLEMFLSWTRQLSISSLYAEFRSKRLGWLDKPKVPVMLDQMDSSFIVSCVWTLLINKAALFFFILELYKIMNKEHLCRQWLIYHYCCLILS